MVRRNTAISATGSSTPDRGQGLLEFALFLPILLLLIAGVVEVSLYANDYMTVLDASREAARFGANLDPEFTTHHPFDMREGVPKFPDVRLPEMGGVMTSTGLLEVCRNGKTTNFYYAVACLAYQNLPEVGFSSLDPLEGDDIVISVVGVARTVGGGTPTRTIARRWPLVDQANPLDPPYHFRGAQNDGDANPSCIAAQTENCRCWSLFGVRTSEFDNEAILRHLQPQAPSTAFVIVEIFHSHPQLIGFFRIGDFIPDPIEMRPYAIFPVPAAEPR